ncbi:uncharacterized protein LOC120007413 isoform X2 [Tripterygium wilfordii]|uniref:uncharacterized protein LOC120007413 isoform X2 n=1 Tax=Tripterygium wilfordii TaxID=458696 RepID=UPI0018F806AC|nr:uncharacterized protein LOC120007413 isoform X2 [Tripterygium wilfordii]
MATMGGAALGFSSFRKPSSYFSPNAAATSSTSFPLKLPSMLGKLVASRTRITCSTVQESSTSTSTSTVDADTGDKKEVKAAEKKAPPPRPKPAAKAPTKSLPEMMEEDIIPALRTILEAQDDISELELSFQDNRLDGSFLKNGNCYSFWAFFPSGGLTGPKGFSLSSHGSGASTVEPFLIDEKKITAQHVVFWVEKRLAAQGIIPVWKD